MCPRRREKEAAGWSARAWLRQRGEGFRAGSVGRSGGACAGGGRLGNADPALAVGDQRRRGGARRQRQQDRSGDTADGPIHSCLPTATLESTSRPVRRLAQVPRFKERRSPGSKNVEPQNSGCGKTKAPVARLG